MAGEDAGTGAPTTTEATAATAAPETEKVETAKPEGDGAKAAEGKPEGDKPEAASDAEEAAKATEAAKALAARKQTANERINELTRARRDAERRAERAEKEAAELRGKLKEPDPATFDDVGKLSAAQVSHALDQREVNRREAEAKAAKEDADRVVREAWQERVSVFKETATDFDEVAYRAPITDEVAKDIAALEEGPQLAYYLGKHPAEARALNTMSERERAVQLGRLAGRLSTTPPRRTTQAPTPVDAVAGKGSQSSSFDGGKASMEDYAARRKAGWRG